MFDLEIWLIGTPHELAAALAALAGVGRIAGASKPEPLHGNDTGRFRRYARISVPIPTSAGKAAPRGVAGQNVIDLDSRRRSA